jgi:hypothetical protein
MIIAALFAVKSSYMFQGLGTSLLATNNKVYIYMEVRSMPVDQYNFIFNLPMS